MVPVTYNLRNLTERKGTTLMTALGIALTVAVLVIAFALTTGLRAVFSGSGDPRQLIVLRKGTDAELTSTVSNEATNIIKKMDGVAKDDKGDSMASPEMLTVINLPSVDSPEGMNVTVRGVLPIGLAMRSLKMEQGKTFEPGRRQVIVGDAIAHRYPSATLGSKIKFGRGLWEVVGVFSAGESATNSEIWADLDQLRGDYDRNGECSSVLVRLSDARNMGDFIKAIGADQRLGAQAVAEKQYYANLTQSPTSIFLQSLGYGVAIIMAIGSAFAATNTMYAAVARRSKEVGTLRALGFSRSSILFSFMFESVCLALLGGILGVLLAFPINGLTTGVGNFQTFSDIAFKFKVSPWAALGGLAFAALIGAVGGFLPAWSAARKDVVQAMREG